MKHQVIQTPGAPMPMAHHCHGSRRGDTLYAASQIASAQALLTDLRDFHGFDQVGKESVTAPAQRTTVKVSGPPVRSGRVAIDLTACQQ